MKADIFTCNARKGMKFKLFTKIVETLLNNCGFHLSLGDIFFIFMSEIDYPSLIFGEYK